MIWLWIGLALAGDWQTISTKGGIVTSKKKVDGTSLFAFRGEAELDHPICNLAFVLSDTPHGPEWVDMQFESKRVRSVDENTFLVYQAYDVPWPISDRDYVMHQTLDFNRDTKQITVHYESVEADDLPEVDGRVRAVATRTYWQLNPIDDGRTKVEVEVLTDPKGALPDWLVNMIQSGWPRDSINGLNEQTERRTHDHPRCADWNAPPAPVPTEPADGPATEASATEASATEASATEAGSTPEAAGADAAGEAPATHTPANESPPSEAPATESPASEAPATESPASESPASEAPSDSD